MASVEGLCFLVLLSWCFFHLTTSTFVGGLHPIDNEDITKYKDLVKGLELAAVEVKKAATDDCNCEYGYVANSLHVESQVVQGVSYHVRADMGPSDCAVKDTTPILECSVDPSVRRVKACTFEIWSRVWLPTKEKLLIENLRCSPKDAEGQI